MLHLWYFSVALHAFIMFHPFDAVSLSCCWRLIFLFDAINVRQSGGSVLLSQWLKLRRCSSPTRKRWGSNGQRRKNLRLGSM